MRARHIMRKSTKMKGLIGLLILVVSVVGEPPAPYAPSGWRPSGPAFELPTRVEIVKSQEYLPPLDPRNQGLPNPEYGTPDVSVLGLPTQEQQPIFQTSPINGQQYQGPNFNADIRNLNQNQRQNLFQQQQEIYRQFERLRQLEKQQNTKASNLPSPQPPRQFASRPATPKSTTPKAEPTTTETPAKQVTEANLNEREILEDEGPSAKLRTTTSVEISKQNLQQYPGEFFLSSLAQLQLQPQFVPLQQIRANYAQPAEATKAVGFDGPAHLAALPSVLAQQQAGNVPQNPQLLIGEELAPGFIPQQPLPQYQPATSYQTQYQQPIALQPQAVEQNYLPANQAAFPVQQQVQYQPAQAFQQQIQAQPIVVQPQQFTVKPSQVGQVQPKEYDDNNDDDERNQEGSGNESNFQNQLAQQGYQPQQQLYQQPQQVYQQPQIYQQPQEIYQQPQEIHQQPQQLYQDPLLIQQQPFNQYQPQPFASQLPQGQYQAQGQFVPQNYQPQDSLQSGLDLSNEENDIDQSEDKDAEEGTAIATAFGARTQPRVFTQYGAPYPEPRQPVTPKYATTTESAVEEVTNPDNAEAVAVAGIRKRNGKLRNRRIRPVIAVDRSGRLVLAAE